MASITSEENTPKTVLYKLYKLHLHWKTLVHCFADETEIKRELKKL